MAHSKAATERSSAGKKLPPPLVVIVGETASGKSSLAIQVAERFNGEIICADSWTVRRGVDIGTAKPTPEERAQIPHHLLDVVEPCADFSAATFKRMALLAIHDISSRSKLPILVGGTGLYIDSVLFDYSFLPAPSQELRSELNGLTVEQLIDRAHQEGISLQGVDLRNKRRIVRALESGGQVPKHRELRGNTVILGLELPREDIDRRITERVDKMFDKGLEHEVARLQAAYGWECEALKGIGYQEWREYFAGAQDAEQTKARIIKNTRALAKRQRTWFRRNKRIRWICKFEETVDLVTTLSNK